MIWAVAGSVPVVIAAILLVLRWRFVEVRVVGRSMEPTLREGDRVLVRRTGTVRRGQIAVLASPWRFDDSPWLIKRVAAAAGDPVPSDEVVWLRDVTDQVVPPERLVLLGDNRAASFDSRRAGYFEARHLLGVVVRTMTRTKPI